MFKVNKGTTVVPLTISAFDNDMEGIIVGERYGKVQFLIDGYKGTVYSNKYSMQTRADWLTSKIYTLSAVETTKYTYDKYRAIILDEPDDFVMGFMVELTQIHEI